MSEMRWLGLEEGTGVEKRLGGRVTDNKSERSKEGRRNGKT